MFNNTYVPVEVIVNGTRNLSRVEKKYIYNDFLPCGTDELYRLKFIFIKWKTNMTYANGHVVASLRYTQD